MSEGMKSSHRRDCILLKCVAANDWEVVKSVGNINMGLTFNEFSMDFGGVNEYITIPHSASLNFERTDSFSYGGWVKTTGGGSFMTKWHDPNVWRGYGMYISNYVRVFLVNNWGGNNRIERRGATFVNDGTWHHMFTTYNGSGDVTGVNIYVDGALETMTNVYNTLSATIQHVKDFEIAARDDGNQPLTGQADECSVWNKELSLAEYQEIYNSGVPADLLTHSAEANLVSWWRMGEEASWTTNWAIPDQKGSNDGTSVNMEEGDRVANVPS